MADSAFMIQYRQEFIAQFDVVINLAIKSEVIPTTGKCHRLKASGTQVNNGKPTVTQSYWAARRFKLLPSATVWPPVSNNIDSARVRRKSD